MMLHSSPPWRHHAPGNAMIRRWRVEFSRSITIKKPAPRKIPVFISADRPLPTSGGKKCGH